MQKIGILVDTTCDMDYSIESNPNIKMIPLQIIFNDGRSFRDKIEISYGEMIASLDQFETKTSLPIIQDAVDAVKYFVENGYTHLFTLMLSSELSGTHGMIKTVSEEYGKELVVENIDTLSATWGIGHVVEQMLLQIDEGKSFEEISSYAKKKFDTTTVFFGVETLKYLIRGGRVSKLSGTVGEALDIKPILELKGGKLIPIEKVRGRKKSLAKLVDLVAEAGKGKEIEKLYVLHGDRLEEGNMLKEKLSEKISAPIEVRHLGTLVSVHVGPGLVGVVSIYK